MSVSPSRNRSRERGQREGLLQASRASSGFTARCRTRSSSSWARGPASHLIQSAAGVMIFAEPRCGSDHSKKGPRRARGRSDRKRRVVSRLLARRPGSNCSSSSAPVRQWRSLARRSRLITAPSITGLAYSGAGSETTFTQGRDSVPRRARAGDGGQEPLAERPRSSSSARCPTWSRISSTALSELRDRSRSSRRATLRAAPRDRPRTSYLLAQPFPRNDRWAIDARGAAARHTPFPARHGRDRAWFEAAARAFGVPAARVAEVVAPQRNARPYRAPDARRARRQAGLLLSGLPARIPLARFLSRRAVDAEAHRGQHPLPAPRAPRGGARSAAWSPLEGGTWASLVAVARRSRISSSAGSGSPIPLGSRASRPSGPSGSSSLPFRASTRRGSRRALRSSACPVERGWRSGAAHRMDHRGTSSRRRDARGGSDARRTLRPPTLHWATPPRRSSVHVIRLEDAASGLPTTFPGARPRQDTGGLFQDRGA